MGRSSIRRRRASVAGALFTRGGGRHIVREKLVCLCWTVSTAPRAPRWRLHQTRALAPVHGGRLREVWRAVAEVPHHELYRLIARHSANRKKAKRSLGRRGARCVQGHLGEPKANPYVGLVCAPGAVRIRPEDR